MGEIRTLSARYHLDPDLRIGWTSANWDRFAIENGAPELAGGTVVGRSILDFVEGEETRILYAAMLARVRESGVRVDLPFRCDSPDVRRFMILHVTRPDGDQLALAAEMLREEPRDFIGLLDSEAPRAGDPIDVCSFCKRVAARGDIWLEAEEAESALELPAGPPFPPLRYAVCLECQTAAEGTPVESLG